MKAERSLLKRLLVGLFAGGLAVILGMATITVAGLRDDLGHADVALVLGSTVNPDGTLSPRLQARLERTVELFKDGWFGHVIVSGGVGKEGHDEAVAMKDYLTAHGVPESQIIVDGHGNTTFDSARNTRDIAHRQHFQSVLVVSQYFHLPRARLALERFHFAKVYSAHAHFWELRDLYSIFRESVGYLSYLRRSYD
jgi:vancomycin permeability regulator SanA